MDSGQNNSFGSPISSGDFDVNQAGGAANPSGMEFQGVVSSGSDDIVIGGVEPKKNRKPMIIALALVGVLAVVAIVLGVVMMSGGGKGGGNVDEEDLSLQESFNLYANYLLYGEKKTDDITGEVSGDQDYAVYNYNGDFSYDEAEELLGNLNDIIRYYYNEDGKVFDNTYLGRMLLSDESALLFLKAYSSDSEYDNERLTELLLRSGFDAALEEVSNNVKRFEDDSMYLDYKEAREKYNGIFLYRVSIFNENGCFEDGLLNGKCAKSIKFDDEHSSERLEELLSAILDIVHEAINELINDVYIVRDEIDVQFSYLVERGGNE